MTNNLLPSPIVDRYAIQYSELVYEAITIYKNSDDKWGVLSEIMPGVFSILVEPVYNSISFNHVLNYLQAVFYPEDHWQVDGKNFYFYDINGQVQASVLGVSTVQIDEGGCLLVLKEDAMGLLDNKGRSVIPFSYVSLHFLQTGIYKAQQGDGYGIIDVSENVLLDFKYRYIFNQVKNDRVIVQDLNSRYFTFHFPTRELHALPYDSIFLASPNTGAEGKTAPGLYKVIRQCQETEFDYYDNGMSAFTGIWGIINADGAVKIPCDYAFVDVFEGTGFFKVAKGVFNFYFEEETGNLIAEGVKWGVVDTNNKIIIPIEYDWVQEAEEGQWVVNKGGTVYFNESYEADHWAVRGGKSELYS
ncbi:hypothetical protein A4D02_26880 [Niastella koreensis]|uniref:KWG Leptospira repeat protein n=2 Tax=Niastella koreensis TaxID=354356 RepID=G8TFM9_NIAKG|nr:WG repeat-containing protein [Niastella koreensis]AEV99468.1 KWG Leptospira repeat protein [Niastella koreensis GR20-10]OQP50064.1 hypothetical protein A4D02_26880 [Niastella koreensis]